MMPETATNMQQRRRSSVVEVMAFAVERIASTASNMVEYMDVTMRPERQKFYEGRSKVAAEQLKHGSFRETLNTMMRQTERIKKGQLAFNVAKSMASRTKKNEEEEAHKPLKLGPFDVWALGIAVVIGGQYFSWNFALAAGFGSCFLSMMLVGAAYVCLVVSNAELTSAMPFAGGAYGLARVSLGLWPGFMVGCCESVEYILYTASSALFLADLIQTTAGTAPFTVPIFIVVFYILALLICIPGGHVFWKTNMFLGVVSFALLLMYNLGALKYINSKEYISALKTTGAVDDTTTRSTFIGGPKAFFTVFPLAGWYYVGVESLNMVASVVHEPRKTVPIGAIACVLTLVATAIFTVSVVPSLPPPTDDLVSTSTALAPLNIGYQLMFKIPDTMAIAISIPATFATAFGFIFASGRVLICMARSGLLPEVFAITFGPYKSPVMAYLIGQGLGLMLAILGFYYPVIGLNLYNICILSAFLAYISQLAGYIVFKRKFPTQEGWFKSPFGPYGAMYAIVIFAIGAVSVIALQPDNQVAFVTVIILFCLYTSAYHFYAKGRQYFSVDEKFIFQVYMTALNASDPSNVQFSNQAADGAPAADSDSDDDDGEKQKQKQNTAKPAPTPTPDAPASGAAASAGGGHKVAVAPEGWAAAAAGDDAGTQAAKPADVVEAFYGEESSVRTGESKTDGTTAV